MNFSRLMLIGTALFCFSITAESMDSLVGRWVNRHDPAQSLIITKTDFGFDLWRSDGEVGRLSHSLQNGGNLRFTSLKLNCLYYAAFTSTKSDLAFKLISGDQAKCFEGVFLRTDDNLTADNAKELRDIYKVPEGVPANGIYSISIKCDASEFNLGEALFRYGVSGFGFVNRFGQFSIAFLRLSFNDSKSKMGKLDGQLLESSKSTELHFTYDSADTSTKTFNGSGNVGDNSGCSLVLSQQ